MIQQRFTAGAVTPKLALTDLSDWWYGTRALRAKPLSFYLASRTEPAGKLGMAIPDSLAARFPGGGWVPPLRGTRDLDGGCDGEPMRLLFLFCLWPEEVGEALAGVHIHLLLASQVLRGKMAGGSFFFSFFFNWHMPRRCGLAIGS